MPYCRPELRKTRSYRPRVCLDSSVVVKWFKVEEESAEALKIRRWAEEGRIKLIISAIVLSESARALKKTGCDKEEIYEILDLFLNVIPRSSLRLG